MTLKPDMTQAGQLAEDAASVHNLAIPVAASFKAACQLSWHMRPFSKLIGWRIEFCLQSADATPSP